MKKRKRKKGNTVDANKPVPKAKAEKQITKVESVSKIPFAVMLGLSGTGCIDKLTNFSEKIIRHRYAGQTHIDHMIGKMEKTYNRYRATNPKYQSKLDANNNISQGVLDHYRECLTEIVLNENVRTENKMTAIKLLLAQHSNQALYRIARSYEAAGDKKNIGDQEGEMNKTIVEFILKSFPKNCDQDLINLASHFSARSDNDWAELAIRRIESAKSLSTICSTFRDDQTDLNCCRVAIECLGDKIEQNLKIIEDYNEGKPSDERVDCKDTGRFNPEDRSTWKIEGNDELSHVLSMLYAAHTGLGNVVVEYANKSDGHLVPGMRKREEEFYRKALNNMKIPGFISKVVSRISAEDSVKRHYCYDRLMALEYYDNNDVLREIIMEKSGVASGMVCKAIEEIDLQRADNSDIEAKLLTDIEDKTNDSNIRSAACLKIHGSHNFEPNDDTKRTHFNVCTRCGAKKSVVPSILQND